MLILRSVAALVAILLIVGVLWDAFETVVLPRRVSHRFRLARAYFRETWRAWTAVARRVSAIERREAILAIYGPLALLLLLALWVFLVILGYALLLWGLGSPLTTPSRGVPSFGADLYFSGVTFLTLGLGDISPHGGLPRGMVVLEVGTGFGMLALVIGYLPILYQAFSHRETNISLLDAHAGSPPTAGALLLRHPPNRRAARLTGILAEWEDWSAELLETHLSYPVLAYYRSQHEDQSWVAALAVILNTCALVLACGGGLDLVEQDELAEQAAFTFAMARHAAVDLAQVFNASTLQLAAGDGRLPPDQRARLHAVVATLGTKPGAALVGASDVQPGDEASADGASAEEVMRRLDELRRLYEPYLEGLSVRLLMALPPWAPEPGALDDWQTTADGVTAPSVAELVKYARARRGHRPRDAQRSPSG